MDKYRNRQEAGQILAQALTEYANRNDVIVLALPRGGVPVGFEIAKQLHAPLDVFIVRKLGVPGHAELAMGALARGNVIIFNEDIISSLGVSKEEIEFVIRKEQQEIERREQAYRGGKEFPSVKDKIVILVDDGIATGATMRAAIAALQVMETAKIVVAVPVADPNICQKIEESVDQLVCPLRPQHLYAVGAWYQDFSQTEDEEVYSLLEKVQS